MNIEENLDTDKPLPTIELHVSPSPYTKTGEAHLLASPEDWQTLRHFFVRHFELWSPTYTVDALGLNPTGFKVKISPDGSEKKE